MDICKNCGSPAISADGRCEQCRVREDRSDNRLAGAIVADKYVIEDKLGSGGMCDVFRARHAVIGKQVAVKVLKPEFAADPQIAKRFEQEAYAASRIRHPNAIDVTDFGLSHENIPYIVMELVDGKTVGELLREEGSFSVERSANIIRQVCGALESAHQAGVIHRDIKPDNIMITEYEGGDWVEVCDFGVAKIQEDVNRRAALTGANFILGTPRYMSPEQCEEKPVDARSDIYSLGVVAYEMLTGEAPFEGNSTRLLICHTFEPPPPLRQRRPDLSPQLEAVVMRALEKDPERRHSSAAEFSQAFMDAAGLFRPEGGNTGGFARVSVPLEVPPGAVSSDLIEPSAGMITDEATLVRKRADASGGGPPPTLRDLADADSFKTQPGVYPDDRGGTRRDVPFSTSRLGEAEGDGPGSSGKKRLLLFALLVAAVFFATLAAFLLFDRRPDAASAPLNPTAGAAAQTTSPQPQVGGETAQTAQPSQTDDGIDSTPDSAGSMPSAEEMAADPPEPEELSAPPPKVDLAQLQKQVISTLNGWTGALERRNLDGHLRHYAPTLHTYYLKRGVSRNYVRSDMERAFGLYSGMRFDFSNIRIRPDETGRRAVATFTKTWDFQGQRNSSGSVIERVWLEKMAGNWRITGVRDLRLNYRNGN